MKDNAAIQTYSSGAFPNVVAINSTGAATQDGTEYIAEQINNGMFGWMQALMDYASLTPDGVIEAAGASQILEAIQKGFGVGPGKLVGWFLDDDPSVTGDRVLLLQEQGILIASYTELVTATYVGDGNNATVHAGGGKFYKSSDAAGTTPDIAGPYLQLPASRGYTLRGLDLGALIDPGGASRFLGDNQADALQGHHHNIRNGGIGGSAAALTTGTDTQDGTAVRDPITDGVNGTPRTSSETRMSNLSIQFGITY